METSSGAATNAATWKRVDDDDDPTPGSTGPTLHGMRRSCEPCRRRKKKCNGGRPCRRCFRTGDECSYSMRVWHLPHAQQQRNETHQQQEQQATQILQLSVSGAVLEPTDMLPLKRCRLSASPATGLVGMQENSFLSDFFGCVGFLPLTTQSYIRETMVNIMLTPLAIEDDFGEAGHFDASAMRGGFGHAFGGDELPMGPSTCIFWCAVALGALTKGSPVESAARYLQLATEALDKSDQYSGLADAEVAKSWDRTACAVPAWAWAMLGYLNGFMGDEAKFQEYLELADTFLTTSIEQGSADALPLGFAEVIQHRQIGDTSHRKIELICSRKQVLPQINEGASEYELYRYVMRSFRVFEQAVFSILQNHSAEENEALDGAEPTDAGTRDHPHHHVVPEAHEISEAMASVWFQDNVMCFAHLEEAVDRPSIRAGIGGMLINGTLAFDTACKGDVRGTLKRIDRCVEVFVRYPGLCRSIMGAHWVHIMSAALAALDASGAREMYEVLRAVYNPLRPLGSPPVPPLEEWQGLSAICEDTYCRAIEGVIASDKMRAFSNPTDRSGPFEVAGVEGDNSPSPTIQNQSRLLTDGEEPVTLASCCPGSSGGRSDPSSAGASSSSLNRARHDGSERCLGSPEAPKTPTSSAFRTLTPNRGNSEAEFDNKDGASSATDVHGGTDCLVGGLVTPPEAVLMMPQELNEGALDDIEEDHVAPADWLDVTHALLDAGDEPGEA